MLTQGCGALVQVCKHTFSFRPVYAPGVPAWLPPAELAAGLASKARRSAAFMARLSLVVTVWLVVPLLTCWLWRLCFLRSLSQVRAIFLPVLPFHAAVVKHLLRCRHATECSGFSWASSAPGARPNTQPLERLGVHIRTTPLM